MVYPFLPDFALGLGVSTVALSRLVSLRGFVSLLSPLFGPLSERYGRRVMMAVSLVLFSIGCAILVLWPYLWAFGLMLAIIALANVVYVPAMQAYVGDTVAYEKRGRVLAITELSWAGAFILGIPILGFVMQRWGLRWPLIGLGILGLIAALMLWLTLTPSDGRARNATTLMEIGQVIKREPIIWAAAIYILLVLGANELLLIVYGDWMKSNFGLSLSSVGLATAVIGSAEVSGELVTARFVDRIGKRPFVITTGIFTALMYLVIPYTSSNLAPALISLFVLFIFFEMSVVGGIPLMTEILPPVRGVVMSVILASGGLGRALGALISPVIYTQGGFQLLGLTATLVMGLAVVILVLWIREASARKQALTKENVP